MLCFITTIRGRTLCGLTTNLVRKMDKMDGPNKGQNWHKSIRWMDPVIKILIHKVDGPNNGQNLHKSTRWTDPTRVKTYISPQGGRTARGIKILVHKVDGPNQAQNLHKTTRWTDPTRVRNFSPQNGRASQEYTIRPIHKVDGYMFQQMHWPLDGFAVQKILKVNEHRWGRSLQT